PPPTDAQIWPANRIRVTANDSLSNTAINRDGYANNGLANAQVQSPNFDVQQQEAVQQQRSRQEFAARAQVQSDYNEISVGNNYGSYVPPGVSFSVMRPIWTGGGGGGDTLLLARQV